MKKAIAILVSALMVMSIFCLSASAADLGVEIAKVEAAAGETVSVDVNITANPGIQATQIEVSFDDSVLELVKVDQSGSILTGLLVNEANPIVIQDSEASLTENNTKTGKVASLQFKVKADAAEGAVAALTAVAVDGCTINCDAEDIAVSITEGSVTVVAPKEDPTTTAAAADTDATTAAADDNTATTAAADDAAATTAAAPATTANQGSSPATGSALPVAAIVLAVSSAAVLTFARKK